ncbi:10515_t:CDS:2, partial [Scutellospora calospora]
TSSESSNEKKYSYKDNEVRNSNTILKFNVEKEIKTDNISKENKKKRFSKDLTKQENSRKETKQNQNIEKLNT